MNKFTVGSVIISSVLLLTAHFAMAAPQLSSDAEISSAGYYQLSWESDADGEYELQESHDSDFSKSRILYQGPDTASLISGRADGTYYYRTRLVNDDSQMENAWSNVVQVEVNHHSLSRAFVFFAVGAVVFIATLVVVLLGTKNQNK